MNNVKTKEILSLIIKNTNINILSQFTIDWASKITDEIEAEINDGFDIDVNIGFINYRIENILKIIKPDIPDANWFNSLKLDIEKIIVGGG